MSRREIRRSSLRLEWLAGLALALAGCRSAADYRNDADRQVYAILEERRAAFAADPSEFTIDPPAGSLREQLLTGEVTSVGPLDLVQALEIAAENSRDYQRRKEQLYLAALDLTLERYRFQVNTTGRLGAALTGTGEDAVATTSGGLGFTRLLGTGAKIVGDIGLNLFRSLATGDGWDAVSSFRLLITQPLLRGFGQRIVLEPLTQAERNVIYEVRSFERFRRTFAVDVATRFYRLLQQADTVANERANEANLAILRERNEAVAEAGRLSQIDVDQARQDELRSTNRLILEEQGFQSQLDEFKFFLGVPVEAALTLDSMELVRLESTGGSERVFSEERLTAVAQRERLDYLTVLDQVDDSRRQVEIAADALRAGLDLSLEASNGSLEGRPALFLLDDASWRAALEMDLPIDRFPERNAFRASLVRYQASVREGEELGDSIRADVRDALRELAATLESWRLQLLSEQLAQRRVERESLNIEAGRAETRDILEAQEALVSAKNASTAARIDYYLALLALARDVEVLRLTERGIELDETLLEEAAGDPPPPQP